MSRNSNTKTSSVSATAAATAISGGATFGFRMGLSLLAVGDLARGYVTLPPGATSQASVGRARTESVPRGRRGGVGNTVGAGAGFVIPLGVVSVGTSERASRVRRRRRVSCAAMTTQQTKTQEQQEGQQQPPTPLSVAPAPSLSPPAVTATIPAAEVNGAASSTTTTSPPNRAGVSRDGRCFAPRGRGHQRPQGRGAGGPRSVVPARNGASGVVGGSPVRLGVISRAEDSGSSAAAKKAKVKGLYLRAQKLLKQHPPDTAGATEKLEEALVIDPRDGHSWLLLARTQERKGATDAARDAFSRATEACPRNVHLWQAWGMLEDKFANLDKARELYQKGLEADAGNPFVCHAWGLMEEKDGKFDKAREILKISKPRVAIVAARGELEASRGNLEEARKIFQEGIDKLSVVADKTARREQSSAKWIGPGRKAAGWVDVVTEAPSEILITWAKVEEQLGGDPAIAEELIERARKGDPHNVKAHIERARFEMHRGNSEKARVILSRAADMPQKEGSLFNLWATLETKEGNLSAAQRISTAAVERFPDDMSLLQTQGTIFGKLGRHEEAISCYRRSVALRPAAPAYVAWAIAVSKLAAEHAGKTSRKKTKVAASSDVPSITTELGSIAKASSPAPTTGQDDDATLQAAAVNTGVTDGEIAGDSAADDSADGDSLSPRSPEMASYAEARRLFELGMKADPTHGPLYNAYGKMEMRLGNTDNAREILQRGISARCTGMPSVWQGLGCLEASLGNKQKAKDVFRRGIIECSRDEVSFLYHSLGSLELASNRPAEAKDVFLEGIARYPHHTQLLLGAALSETKSGSTDDAREYFKRAVQSDPTHAHAWQAWGVMECRGGNQDVARTLWESGLKNCPRHGPLWQWDAVSAFDAVAGNVSESIDDAAYAVMEMTTGETDRARRLFEAGVERCPDHVQLHQAWAVMEARAGNLDVARKLVLDGLRTDPYHGALWTVYALIEKQEGDEKKARKVFELGTRACPTHGPLYRAWGQTEFKSACPVEARRAFEKGLDLCPAHKRLYYAYADMEAMQGNNQSLEWLIERGVEALTKSGASPLEIDGFTEKMETIVSTAMFDARANQERYDDAFDLD